MGSLVPRVAASQAARRGVSPTLAKFLDDLAMRQRQADAANDARRLEVHFGRRPADDPFAGVGEDAISAMVGATAAPRPWLEAAEYNSGIANMMPTEPPMPLADALLRNDRTRALVNTRLDRIDPSQRGGSLGWVARIADAEASAARAAERAAAARSREMMPVTATGAAVAAALAGGQYLKMRDEAARARAAEAEQQAARDSYRQNAAEALQDGTAYLIPERVPESPLSWEGDPPLAYMADEIPIGGDVPLPDFTELPPVKIDMDPPERAVEYSPGPTNQVRASNDMETLPGPQMRSVRALIRKGIPPSRAMDIVVKGHSMTTDEYRQVTGVQR